MVTNWEQYINGYINYIKEFSRWFNYVDSSYKDDVMDKFIWKLMCDSYIPELTSFIDGMMVAAGGEDIFMIMYENNGNEIFEDFTDCLHKSKIRLKKEENPLEFDFNGKPFLEYKFVIGENNV